MNILILNWRDIKHPNAGGAEMVTLEHAKAWVAKGHRVFWFASYFKGAKEKEVFKKVTIIRKGRQYFDVQIRAFWWYFFGEHPKFDLVVDQFHGIPFFTPLYVKGKKLAFIHEVAKEVWYLNHWQSPFNLIAATIGSFLEPWIFKIFYRRVPFMTVSESTKKDLVDWSIPEKNITVIHNGVTLVKAKTLIKERQKTAIYLGALARDKGIDDAVETFGLIDKKDKNLQFLVVGKGDEKMTRQMKAEAKNALLGKKFKYWGHVNDRKKFELLARAHVLINPSAREGWGLVNIEANSVGTPVVAYDVPGIRDSVKDGFSGILCREKSPACLAEEALKLVGKETRYKKISTNAKKWSRKFNWKKATQESLQLLHVIG